MGMEPQPLQQVHGGPWADMGWCQLALSLVHAVRNNMLRKVTRGEDTEEEKGSGHPKIIIWGGEGGFWQEESGQALARLSLNSRSSCLGLLSAGVLE